MSLLAVIGLAAAVVFVGNLISGYLKEIGLFNTSGVFSCLTIGLCVAIAVDYSDSFFTNCFVVITAFYLADAIKEICIASMRYISNRSYKPSVA